RPHAVKEHPLDTNVVMEIFQVTNSRCRAAEVHVDGWGSVGRKRKMMGLAQCCCLKKTRDASAAGRVRLQYVHGASVEHPPKIACVISIFPSGNVHSRRSAIAQQSQAFKVIRRNRLLKPADTQVSELLSLQERLFSAARSIRIHKQLCIWTDRRSSSINSVDISSGISPNLHLDAGDALLHPTSKLALQLFFGIGRESTAAINRNGLPHRSQQGH